MLESKHPVGYMWRYSVAVVLVFISILLLSLVLSAVGNSVQAQEINPETYAAESSDYADSPNLVTSAGAHAISGLGNSLSNLQVNANNGVRSVGNFATENRQLVLRSLYSATLTSARGVGAAGIGVIRGFGWIFKINARAMGMLLRIPGSVLQLVARSPVADKFIRPSDHTEVSIIDPNSPELKAAVAALPPSNTAAPQPTQNAANQGPQWPIHGQITTEFGVVHWPYQPTHTGIDISDGKRSGITPVKSFRPGKVIEVIHSTVSLGNHVIIDHGNGVTSVYGHMASTAVQVGQQVDLTTTLGYEGSTGASTGPHVHLEIRVNGQAANPHQFISGNPY